MILFKAALISYCCLMMTHYVQCLEDKKGGADFKKDTTAKNLLKTTSTTTSTESTIYKIKRLDDYDKEPQSSQPAINALPKKRKFQRQQQPAQHLSNGDLTTNADAHNEYTKDGQQPRTKALKSKAKNSHRLNKKLLGKLGFTKVKAPNSHNRKRLAIESRRHASPDDSHMFIIKLPPNMYYYASPSKVTTSSQQNDLVPGIQQTNSIRGIANTTSTTTTTTTTNHQHHHIHQQTLVSQLEKEALNANGKKVLFPFSSNGKPGRIYHWNLPVIKKILEDKQRFPNVSPSAMDAMIDIKDIATWTKPWENETHDHKSYGKSSMMSYKKSLKRKSPSYYAPANAVNKNSFNKYFSGNGKPKGFYVIKENQKKPLYYKNIVS